MIEILQYIVGIILVLIMGRMVWESAVILDERKQRYRNGTHDYYDNPIEEDWDMLPDVEDLEKIVDRELKKLK
tara:strand:- start:2538 stop:2756 length:219 start_codon:yes stop_codon:yes gene_type:complete